MDLKYLGEKFHENVSQPRLLDRVFQAIGNELLWHRTTQLHLYHYQENEKVISKNVKRACRKCSFAKFIED